MPSSSSSSTSFHAGEEFVYLFDHHDCRDDDDLMFLRGGLLPDPSLVFKVSV